MTHLRQKRVFLTHHEPTRSDADLVAVFDEVIKRHDVGRGGDSQFELAQEGLLIEI
ncbi:MAG: hypothetical protein KME36_08195 [Candidatus Thiodiazotropha sp. (ex Lucina pensylvanica)]|nr:hypothetical protein [Candidatus Thiodiazotropha sp. (ex Lucina pensylvanica)]MBT3039890.1 hypothetical protein [Candidatus Thiodiazotropha sp. (ex Codakia orbicularis)]MBT3052823.1 hypothetical protein [Candidatus Thiodiazotropha sp. (ex Codakia orbicularis)]